jgi:sugar phosphate isomerase/epimerase
MELGILLSGSGLAIPSWETGFDLAADMGYTQVELAGNDVSGKGGAPDLGKCDAAEAKRLVEAAGARGLGVSAIQSHQCFPLGDEAALAASVAHTQRMIDLAAATGVPVVHTTTGQRSPGIPEGTMWRMLCDVYTALLDHAQGQGMKVAVEPVFVYSVGNLATLRRLFEVVGRPDLYLNYDPSHFPYHDEDPVPPIVEFGDRLVHAHAKDAVVEPDTDAFVRGTEFEMPGGRRFRFAPPGEGQTDHVAVVRALRGVGFDGVLSLELGHGIGDPEAAARANVPFMREVLRQARA